MVTLVDPHCSIWGYDFSSIVRAGGVSSSGGAIKVEEIQSTGRKWADVRELGRQPKKYRIVAASPDREEIEAFLEEVNTAPVDSEFYPHDAARCGYIASAWAIIKTKQETGAPVNLYEAIAEITCREAWLCGPDQGIDMSWSEPLDVVSGLLTNGGQERAPISYLQLSSPYYLPYIENLSVRITPGSSTAEHDRELQLCEKMLRGDIIDLGWRGEFWHSWEADLSKTLPQLSLDVHGKTYGGAVADGVLTLQNGEYFMIPFYGPLLMAGSDEAASLELTVDALTGDGAAAQVAFSTDLMDMSEVDHDDLVVGSNTILIPDLEGETLVFIGIKAAASGSVSLSGLKGTVKRHVSPSQIPWTDPGESFKIRIEATAGERLRFVQAFVNNRYWY